jgi:hypothetical protein
MAAARPFIPPPATFGAAAKAEAKQDKANNSGHALHGTTITDLTRSDERCRNMSKTDAIRFIRIEDMQAADGSFFDGTKALYEVPYMNGNLPEHFGLACHNVKQF